MKRYFYFWFENGLPDWQKVVAQEALEYVLSLLKIREYFKTFIVPDNSTAYKTFRSMECYKKNMYVISPNGLRYNVQNLLLDIQVAEDSNSSYHIFVFNNMICGNGGGLLAGLATGTVASVISNNAFKLFSENECREWFRTLCFHEIGHMFGLPRKSRLINLSTTDHCSNVCVMRSGTTSYHRWMHHTYDRQKTNVVYCNDCHYDLLDFKNNFIKTAKL